MKVWCKNLEKKDFSVEAELGDDLNKILSKLHDAYGIDPETSSLIYAGEVLHDLTKTLENLKYRETDWFVIYPRKIKQKSTETASKSAPTSRTPIAEVPSNVSNQTTVRISEEAIQSLVAILQADPNCAALLRKNPRLINRIRDPQVLFSLANMIGLDLTRFMRRLENDATESQSPAVLSTGVPTLPAVSEISTVSPSLVPPKQVVLPLTEIKKLQEIKANFMNIIGELPDTITEGQINTMVYEAYQAAQKDPEQALNILIDNVLAFDDE